LLVEAVLVETELISKVVAEVELVVLGNIKVLLIVIQLVH
tara:strand:+ start:15 stop:134 length:120 start_codon:yes stop_codon:yes gene_type:complete